MQDNHVRHTPKGKAHLRCKCKASCRDLKCPHHCKACRPPPAVRKSAADVARELPERSLPRREAAPLPGVLAEDVIFQQSDPPPTLGPTIGSTLSHLGLQVSAAAQISGSLGSATTDGGQRVVRAAVQAMRAIFHKASELLAPADSVELERRALADLQRELAPEPEQLWLTPAAKTIVRLLTNKRAVLSAEAERWLLVSLLSMPERPTNKQLETTVGISDRQLALVSSCRP
jgi:hypothetical protein